jgi:hypothetical protein
MSHSKTPRPRHSGGQTSPPGPTVDPPGVLVEAVEFLDRMKGTLPEQITAADLETLNAGLRYFFSDLHRASNLFHQSGDSGRRGAIKALAAAWRLIALFKQPFAQLLHVPILHLQDALVALDGNTVSPMLRPLRRSGRGSSTGIYAALRGCVAGTVERLVRAGLEPRQARDQVAKALVKLGVRPERGKGPTTERTIRGWCEAIAADVGRRGEGAIVYDTMFTEDELRAFSALQSDTARAAHALNLLAAFVQAHFPTLPSNPAQKPT